MKFTLALASGFALALTLVKASTINIGRRWYDDHKHKCDYPQVLENTTIADYNGYPIGFAATYCPEDCKDKEDKKYARDYDHKDKDHKDKCYDHKYKHNKDSCYLSCVDFGYPLYPDDCWPVIDYLKSLDSESFTVPAETYYEWYYGTCYIVFWNFDCCDYDVCYDDFAYDAYYSAQTCLGSTCGSVCEGSGKPGDDYAVIIA